MSGEGYRAEKEHPLAAAAAAAGRSPATRLGEGLVTAAASAAAADLAVFAGGRAAILCDSILICSTWDSASLLNQLFSKYLLKSRNCARREGYKDNNNRYLALLASCCWK